MDIELAIAERDAQDVPQMVCQKVRQMFTIDMAKGCANKGIAEMATLIEDWAGCEIRARQ